MRRAGVCSRARFYFFFLLLFGKVNSASDFNENSFEKTNQKNN
jgi:hypothetical protein